jgi:hypothetical protein
MVPVLAAADIRSQGRLQGARFLIGPGEPLALLAADSVPDDVGPAAPVDARVLVLLSFVADAERRLRLGCDAAMGVCPSYGSRCRCSQHAAPLV